MAGDGLPSQPYLEEDEIPNNPGTVACGYDGTIIVRPPEIIPDRAPGVDQ